MLKPTYGAAMLKLFCNYVTNLNPPNDDDPEASFYITGIDVAQPGFYSHSICIFPVACCIVSLSVQLCKMCIFQEYTYTYI